MATLERCKGCWGLDCPGCYEDEGPALDGDYEPAGNWNEDDDREYDYQAQLDAVAEAREKRWTK